MCNKRGIGAELSGRAAWHKSFSSYTFSSYRTHDREQHALTFISFFFHNFKAVSFGAFYLSFISCISVLSLFRYWRRFVNCVGRWQSCVSWRISKGLYGKQYVSFSMYQFMVVPIIGGRQFGPGFVMLDSR